MKVVVISTSLRAGSNSHALAEQFAEGAKSAGHDVELISLRGKEIKFCIGCLKCQETGACVFKTTCLRSWRACSTPMWSAGQRRFITTRCRVR